MRRDRGSRKEMKLISLLEIMYESDEIVLDDENAPIDEMTLFH